MYPGVNINANFKVTETDFLNQKPEICICFETVWESDHMLHILITVELQR